jgi:hypothetical protein
LFAWLTDSGAATRTAVEENANQKRDPLGREEVDVAEWQSPGVCSSNHRPVEVVYMEQISFLPLVHGDAGLPVERDQVSAPTGS